VPCETAVSPTSHRLPGGAFRDIVREVAGTRWHSDEITQYPVCYLTPPPHPRGIGGEGLRSLGTGAMM